MKKWFSSKCRFGIFVYPDGAKILNDCIFLLRAIDFEDAKSKILNLCKTKEKEYKNGEGFVVEWRFMEIITIDILKNKILDGSEVYSDLIELEDDSIIGFERKFYPENSKPFQTI